MSSVCAICGLDLFTDAAAAAGVCPHHAVTYGDDWAAVNRIMCAGLHRRTWPPRLPLGERDPEPTTSFGGAS